MHNALRSATSTSSVSSPIVQSAVILQIPTSTTVPIQPQRQRLYRSLQLQLPRELLLLHQLILSNLVLNHRLLSRLLLFVPQLSKVGVFRIDKDRALRSATSDLALVQKLVVVGVAETCTAFAWRGWDSLGTTSVAIVL